MSALGIVMIGFVVLHEPTRTSVLGPLFERPESMPATDSRAERTVNVAKSEDGDDRPDYSALARQDAASAREKVVEIGRLDKDGNVNFFQRSESTAGVTQFQETVRRAQRQLDDGISPMAAIKDAEAREKQLAAAIDEALPLKKKADELAKAAEAASTQVAAYLKAAREAQASPDVISSIEKSAQEAADAGTEARRQADDFTEFENQIRTQKTAFDAVVKDLDGVRQRVAACNAAFATLRDRMRDSSQVPKQSIGSVLRAELCDVGGALIEIDVPAEPVHEATGSKLVCRRSEIQVTSSDQSAEEDAPKKTAMWDLMWDAPGPGSRRGIPIGKLVIIDGKLSAEKIVDKDIPLAIAHDALAMSVLRVRNALDGTGNPPPEAVAFVQLSKPIEAGPIVFKALFDGDEARYPIKSFAVRDAGLPAKPANWPATFVLKAATCGNFDAQVVKGRSVNLALARGSGGLKGKGELFTWSIAWNWKRPDTDKQEGKDEQKPRTVVVTDFALGDSDDLGGLPKVKVLEAELQDPWNTLRRLVPLKSKSGDEFIGFPNHKAMTSQTTEVTAQALLPLVNTIFAKSKEDATDPASRDFIDTVKTLIRPETRRALPLDKWKGELESRVKTNYPIHNVPDKGATEADKSKHAETKRAHDKAMALMGRINNELDAIEAGKAEVRAMIKETCDYDFADEHIVKRKNVSPDATITGEVVIDFPSISARSVLVSFGADRSAAPTKGVNAPNQDDLK